MNNNHCNVMVVRLHVIKIDARQFLKINIFDERLCSLCIQFMQNL